MPHSGDMFGYGGNPRICPQLNDPLSFIIHHAIRK